MNHRLSFVSGAKCATMGGCQDVAIVFKWLLVHFYAVARVF